MTIKHPPSEPQAPRYVPFPTDEIPSAVAAFIHQGAAALGCDESYIALPLLAVLATAVGNSRRIRLKRTWCEPATVWAVVVGDSGTLKSPAHDLAIKPLYRLQDAAFKEHQNQLEQYSHDQADYTANLAAWKDGRKKGKPQPQAPTKPVATRYVVSDTTVEALAVLLCDQPRGLLVARDELSGWLNSFDAYKGCRGADVAHWLSMHRAGPLIVDRKSEQPPVIYVPHAAICIAGGVQPAPLASALIGRHKQHFDNGLAARLLFAMPPRKPKQWTEDELPRDVETALETVISGLMGLDMPTDHNGQPQPRDIPLSPKGKRAWIDFYNAHASEEAAMNGNLAAAWSKLEGYAARFALLVHLIRSVSNDPPLADPGAIDEQSISAGVALSQWFGAEAIRVYGIIGGVEPEAKNLREIIQSKGGSITVRGLMQASRKYRDNAAEAEAALADLVKAGDGKWETDDHDGGRGRPAKVFQLLSGGNGNGNGENPEEKRFPLPGEAHGHAADAEKQPDGGGGNGSSQNKLPSPSAELKSKTTDDEKLESRASAAELTPQKLR